MVQSGARRHVVATLLAAPVVLLGARVTAQEYVNVAPLGTATQSTTNGGFVASLGINGNLVIGDVNGDGGLNVSDIVYLANYLFLGGAPPTQGTACLELPPEYGCPDNVGCQ